MVDEATINSRRFENAMRWYKSSYYDTHPDDFIVKLVIAGECLCPNDHGEIRLQFSLFLSMFAAAAGRADFDKAEAVKVYKALYDRRSKLVHGAMSSRKERAAAPTTLEQVAASLLQARRAIGESLRGYARLVSRLGSDEAVAQAARAALNSATIMKP